MLTLDQAIKFVDAVLPKLSRDFGLPYPTQLSRALLRQGGRDKIDVFVDCRTGREWPLRPIHTTCAAIFDYPEFFAGKDRESLVRGILEEVYRASSAAVNLMIVTRVSAMQRHGPPLNDVTPAH